MHQLQQVALDLFEALDTPVSLGSAILTRYGEWDQLAQRSTDPTHYLDPHTYYRDVQSTGFLRKVEDLPTSIDKAQAAVDGWLKAEQHCYLTNIRITHALSSPEESTLTGLIRGTRKKMHELLGRRVPCYLNQKHGNGSTYEHKGVLKLLPNKFDKKPSMTVNAWSFLSDWAETAWCHDAFSTHYDATFPSKFLGQRQLRSRYLGDPSVVRGNRFSLARKNGKTDRAIAIEPTLNLYYQLGLGGAIRSRLRLHHLLEVDSQEVHKSLAAKASIDDDIATLDQTMASDTQAYQLIKAVTPHDWFCELDAARSPYTIFPGSKGQADRVVLLEKFSSMGNGATFELETAVFAAVCLHVAEELGVLLIPRHNFSVYGDDIICPAEMAQAVTEALVCLGFIPNKEKSFTTGPFRESCGGDFFRGISVRPAHQDKIPSCPADWYSLYNRLERIRSFGLPTGRAQKRVLGFLPQHLRENGGPVIYGDAVLHGIEPRLRMKGSKPCIRVLSPPKRIFGLERWADDLAVATLMYANSRGSSLSDEVPGSVPYVDRPPLKGETDGNAGAYVLKWVSYRPEGS